MILCVPPCKGSKPLANADFGPEIVIPLKGPGIREGHGHIPRLHAYQLPMPLEVVILREYTRAHQFLLKYADEVQQVLRLAAADVVHRIGRNRQAVRSVPLFRRSPHDADDALHDVVDEGDDRRAHRP